MTVAMDFGAFAPEINSARMYAGAAPLSGRPAESAPVHPPTRLPPHLRGAATRRRIDARTVRHLTADASAD